MLRTNTDSNPGFITGFVTAIITMIVLGILKNVTQWLQHTKLADITAWWTTEQTITYVPLDVLSFVFSILLMALIFVVMLGYVMIGPRM